ncbi:MAG: hypothetical protein PHX44_09395 [Sulfurimonas sp.]|uniref:hypothetical protein n=1 Tax=Sulfurimonas sp. TaxID=2022749 RepID=UPI002621B057|nr:hypothetical protein [Sulfurimonas sp.]MDD2653249.1 hypothetical protein [Sulfurimonas sp.]MDD3452288.1 hypothetical protein [Sulfurimonas sp.]
MLSSHTAHLLQGFSDWLKQRRGAIYASLKLQRYYKFFSKLDQVAKELDRFPTYEEMVQFLSVMEARKYLLVTLYLQDIKQIIIDKAVQEEYANLDMIDRLLQYFEKDDYRYKLLFEYYTALRTKADQGKTSIRSIRLALTPAEKFLKYCDHFEKSEISDEALSGYLWVYRGQKSAIFGFVSFLNQKHKFSLEAHRNLLPIKTPRYSRKQLKQKFIELLQNPQDDLKYQQKLLRFSLGYLYHIDIPNNAFINQKDIQKDKNDAYCLRLVGKKFYLPNEITRLMLD